jgi:cytochrome c6
MSKGKFFGGRVGVGLACALILLLGMWLPSATVLAAPEARGSALFEIHCVGCHPQGGNIIRRGKSLKARALKRHGYDTPATVIDIITQGRGLMSAYEDRLTPAEIETLATYVLDRAQENWQSE